MKTHHLSKKKNLSLDVLPVTLCWLSRWNFHFVKKIHSAIFACSVWSWCIKRVHLELIAHAAINNLKLLNHQKFKLHTKTKLIIWENMMFHLLIQLFKEYMILHGANVIYVLISNFKQKIQIQRPFSKFKWKWQHKISS